MGRLDAAMLGVRLPNGWTVAGALAHIAFWDRQRLCLMRRWAAGDLCSGAYDGDLFNAALQPLLELIPPERAAAAAVQAAEEVDALLLEISDEVVAAALARPDARTWTAARTAATTSTRSSRRWPRPVTPDSRASSAA